MSDKKAIRAFHREKEKAKKYSFECWQCGVEIEAKQGQEKYCETHFLEKMKYDERKKELKKEVVYIKEVEKKNKKKWRFRK